MTYLRDPNERIVITTVTNMDGITWEPWTDGESIGFRVIEVDTGRVEIVKLTPTGSHDINPDNGATADVFLYHDATGTAEGDGDAVTYINLFETPINPG